MSDFGATPAAIKAALDSVDGVRGYELKPAAPKPGDGWPRWASSAHSAPGVLEDGWQVIILLTPDEAKQREWIAARRWELLDALQSGADGVFVEGMEAGSVGDSPALLINCRE